MKASQYQIIDKYTNKFVICWILSISEGASTDAAKVMSKFAQVNEWKYWIVQIGTFIFQIDGKKNSVLWIVRIFTIFVIAKWLNFSNFSKISFFISSYSKMVHFARKYEKYFYVSKYSQNHIHLLSTIRLFQFLVFSCNFVIIEGMKDVCQI